MDLQKWRRLGHRSCLLLIKFVHISLDLDTSGIELKVSLHWFECLNGDKMNDRSFVYVSLSKLGEQPVGSTETVIMAVIYDN